MSDVPLETLRKAFAEQSLFEEKTWRLSPRPWVLTPAQVQELEAIGSACLEFHQALETLYLRSASGKNLLRNRPLLAPWVAEYLDRGKPEALIAHARDGKNRGAFPTVLRPDLLWTDDGFAMTELDSVPGGIGLTAFLNRLYENGSGNLNTQVLGGGDAMVRNFYDSLASLRADLRNPLIALVVSDEAATYRPEMHWLAEQLQRQGKRVFCLEPDDLFPLGTSLCFDMEGNPEKIDVLYRFFELFDYPQLGLSRFMLDSWKAGELAIAPPMRAFQEEKLALALFHHHQLADFWSETLSRPTLELLRRLIPKSWIIDPAPLPPGAVLDGPTVGGRALTDWRQLALASQKERELILKISGFHETAWGARSVVLGNDCSREEWQQALDLAITDAPTHLHLLQRFRKPSRLRHPVFAADGSLAEQDGRLRLCPYYFVISGKTQLSGALATFCPPDKKIIHGMVDAALLPSMRAL
ncbi:hypothetical protein [Nibricoccus sp. IMCC34717]|uniref:hypothetical protein n=1 Tax=Nibricoccus sp. IMCC34717 TaxID=3034021 RepID=UPI00384EAA68